MVKAGPENFGQLLPVHSFFIPVSISFSDSELEERARRYYCSATGKRPAETWRSGVVGRRSIQLGRRRRWPRRRPRLNASPSVDARGVARAGTLPTASRHDIQRRGDVQCSPAPRLDAARAPPSATRHCDFVSALLATYAVGPVLTRRTSSPGTSDFPTRIDSRSLC